MTNSEMTSRERFLRIYQHREADRIPIVDSPWNTTIQRWILEGIPKEPDFRDYFGLAKELGSY